MSRSYGLFLASDSHIGRRDDVGAIGRDDEWAPAMSGRSGARRWRDVPPPLGAQRRPVREGKDMLRGDRNVGVIRKASVTRCDGDNVSERNARRDDRDWRSTTTLPEAGALLAAL